MKSIVVTEETSTIDGRTLHNRIVWREADGTRTIIAIGAPHEWNSRFPLPPMAVVTDLVEASVEDPKLARPLWGEFLGYLLKPKMPAWYPILPSLIRPRWIVSVEIPDHRTSSAVRYAIEDSQGRQRFRMKS